MGFCTLAPGGTRFQIYRPNKGMVGVDVHRQGPEKSLVEVGIELEALQSEDCHHSYQATWPDSLIVKVAFCVEKLTYISVRRH